jgi:hypothetical protein
MLTSKIRFIVMSLVASTSFAVAALLPTASQAQWHHYCVKGLCTEHANYTYGNPCSSSGQAASLSPEKIKEEEERKKKEEEEGKVHGEEVEKFFYGCDGAAPKGSSVQPKVSSPTVTASRAVL